MLYENKQEDALTAALSLAHPPPSKIIRKLGKRVFLGKESHDHWSLTGYGGCILYYSTAAAAALVLPGKATEPGNASSNL